MLPRFNPRLTLQEIETIEREATLSGRDFSEVVDASLRAYLAATDQGRKGIVVYPVEDKLTDRKYTIRPETARQLRRLKDRRISAQDVLRAAIAHLAKGQTSR